MRVYCIVTRTILDDITGYIVLRTGFIIVNGETFNVAVKAAIR